MLLKLIEDVERAIEHECYFAALALALTLPDICGKAEYPNDGDTARYIKWCREFVCGEQPRDDPRSGDMPYLSGEMLFNLRCCFLHQGTPSIDPSKIKDERCAVDQFNLLITDPDSADGELSMVEYGGNWKITHREITVSIRDICYRLRMSAKKYYEENPDKFTFFDCNLKDERKKSNQFYYLQGEE